MIRRKMLQGWAAIAAGMMLFGAPCFAETGDAPILHSPVMAAEKVAGTDFTAYKWRLDTDSLDGMPVNFRTTESEFGRANPKYGLDESYAFSREGLDTLHISGSGEYSEAQFAGMLSELEQYTERENIYIIDLRQESHIFADGIPICWWGERDWSNLGKGAAEIEAEESLLAEQTAGTTITAVPQTDTADGSGSVQITVGRAMTERELAEGAGVRYYRFPCPDHIWPDAAQIDAFISLVKTLPDNAWLHFHCVAGKGRTGALMCIYDIMRNPGVKLKDIAYRQHLLGANYLLDKGDSSWTGPYKAEITLMLTAFYNYVQECGPDGYETGWSEWLLNR